MPHRIPFQLMEIVNRWLYIIPLDKFLCQTRAKVKNCIPLSIPIQFVGGKKTTQTHTLILRIHYYHFVYTKTSVLLRRKFVDCGEEKKM